MDSDPSSIEQDDILGLLETLSLRDAVVIGHSVLVLSGGPTSWIPPRRLADVTAEIPGARLATIPVGHRVHSLAPDEFFAEVAAFLTESAVTATSAGK